MNFTTTILQWFSEYGRQLPWRETRDPYAIWLSEIILQQTRIEQGMPYWQRFMQRWPTVNDLAAASEDEVLKAWQGLGYYSRARNLHHAAKQIVAQGRFPDTLEGIKALKGVGDYTAAAIGSFAFDLPAAVVDGNVYRVLARHYGISTPINSMEGKKEFAALAQELLPVANCQQPIANSQQPIANCQQLTATYNQAMMDFGALQCTPQHPQCLLCPLQESCVALREGWVAELPVKTKTLKIKERHITYVYIRCNGQTAFRRRPAGDIWQGLWEPWLTEQVPSGAVLLRQKVKHVLTHRVLYADFWLWEVAEKPSLPDDYLWISEDDVDQYGVPRLVEIMLDAVRRHIADRCP